MAKVDVPAATSGACHDRQWQLAVLALEPGNGLFATGVDVDHHDARRGPGDDADIVDDAVGEQIGRNGGFRPLRVPGMLAGRWARRFAAAASAFVRHVYQDEAPTLRPISQRGRVYVGHDHRAADLGGESGVGVRSIPSTSATRRAICSDMSRGSRSIIAKYD